MGRGKQVMKMLPRMSKNCLEPTGMERIRGFCVSGGGVGVMSE